MTVKSRRGAALGYVLVVGTLLFVLAAALLPVASGMTEATANGVDSKISYIDAKSAIEYAKAVVKYQQKTNGNAVSDFYVTGTPNADGTITFSYALGSPSPSVSYYARCHVDAAAQTVRIDAASERLDRQGSNLSLVYGYTPAQTIVDTVPSGYVRVIESSNSISNVYQWGNLSTPVVFKNTFNVNDIDSLTQSDKMIGKGLYFMGTPSLAADNALFELSSKLIYFSGNITARNTSWWNNLWGIRSEMVVEAPGQSDPVYIYFKNVTITSIRYNGSQKTITLDGIYQFTGSSDLDLFDIDNINTRMSQGRLTRLDGSAYASALSKFDGNILNSTVEQRASWISSENAGWSNFDGSSFYDPDSRAGKSVFFYVPSSLSFVHLASTPTYEAQTINIYSDADSVEVGNDISFNTSYICFENMESLEQWFNNSSIKINVPSGGKTVIEFKQDTKIVKHNGHTIYTIKRGKYEITQSVDLLLESEYNSGGLKKATPFTVTGIKLDEGTYVR